MNIPESASSELLTQEKPYSGKFYHLSPPDSKDVSLEWLKNQLNEKKIEVEKNFDFIEKDHLHIPRIFEPDESVNEASFGKISRIKRPIDGLLGVIKHNEPDTVTYEQKEVLILETQETRFVLFEKRNQYYLSMLGRRSLVNSVMDLITEELEEMGFAIDDATIRHAEFEDIQEDLMDDLRTTTIRGYPSPTIEGKDIRGRGYEKAREYEREKEEGVIHGQQFETAAVDGSSKTVQISGDGLVRTYSNMSLSSYLDMLGNYIVPNVSQFQTSIRSYESKKTSTTLNEFTDV